VGGGVGLVGKGVGLRVDDAVGREEVVGEIVGDIVGDCVGESVGLTVGESVGLTVGERVYFTTTTRRSVWYWS
jgi:hypothetical protein